MKSRWAYLLTALSLLSAWSIASESLAEEVILADGSTFAGTLQRITDAQFEFAIADQTRGVAHDDLLRIGQFVHPRKYPRVTLRDGSQLVAYDAVKPSGVIQFANDEFTISGTLWRQFQVARTAVASIQFRAAVGLLPGSSEADDSIRFVDDDRITGDVVSIRDSKVKIRVGGDTIDLPLNRVVAIQFATPTEYQAPRPRFHIGLRDGANLVAASIQLAEGRASVTPASGTAISLRQTDIVAIQVNDGRAKYLSDLRPLAYRHTPYLSGTWPLGIDRSAAPETLRAGGAPYRRGIGMHSHARVVFKLDGKYRRFLAMLAIDDEATDVGSVEFRVLNGDGTGNWQSAYVSPIVRGGDAPTPVDIDVVGVEFMALIVDYADRTDQRDLANWLDARLLP